MVNLQKHAHEGKWVYRLKPMPDELLSSWLIRNARAHGLSPSRFMSLIFPARAIWSRDLDRNADLNLLKIISYYSGVQKNSLEEMTLGKFVSILGRTHPSHGILYMMLSAGIISGKRKLHWLQYCPKCLSEQPCYYRKIWRLSFVVYCNKHNILLKDSCPLCDKPIVPHRSLHPAYCFNCWSRLDSNEFSSPVEVPISVRILQDRCLKILISGKASLNDSVKCSAKEFFILLRDLLGKISSIKSCNKLRELWGLGKKEEGAIARYVFESSRLETRIVRLETVAFWIKDWPDRFIEGAEFIGLSGASFSRDTMPNVLEKEVKRLPARKHKRRSIRPRVFSSDLAHLRKISPESYRNERARRIMDIVENQ